MLSKLLPRTAPANIAPFVYRPVGPAAQSGSLSSRSSHVADPGAAQEVQLLRLRIAEIERSATARVAEANRAGAHEGETAARLKAESAIKPVLERMALAIETLITLRARSRKELEAEAVQLSLAIARRVLRRELSVDSGALQGLIAAAYERISRQEIIRVVVDPYLAAAVQDALGRLSTRQIELVVDPARERGTLIFETARGALDASVDSQFREIELGLADRLKSR